MTGIAMEESALEPMERLMLAVLEDAIMQFQHGLGSRCPQKRRLFHEVGRWFQNRDHDSPFSFESVCHVLRLDPECLREGLSGLRRQSLAAPARRPQVRLRRSPIDSLPPANRARARAR